MASGADTLSVARIAFGTGTSALTFPSYNPLLGTDGTFTGATQTRSVYGEVPASQNARTGTYTDDVPITVTLV